MRALTTAALALGVAASSLTPVLAQPLPATPDLSRAYPGEDYAQFRHRPHGEYYYGRPFYAAPRYYYRRDNGAAVAAGVAGLAAGALIAGAIANQAQAAPPPPPATVNPQLAAWCARRYRSFDSVSGTYMAVSGERIACTY